MEPELGHNGLWFGSWGLGAEYAFTQNWTGFIEYNYIEFDKKNSALDGSLPAYRPSPMSLSRTSFRLRRSA